MFKIKSLIVLLVLGLVVPGGFLSAAYNTTTWGPGYRLFFGGVAPEDGGVDGISIDINANTYLHSYIKDVSSLQVTMWPGSEIHLKSLDGKLFETSVATAETVCGDGYSTFDYTTPDTSMTFVINLADGSNCEQVMAPEETVTVPQEINVENLASILKTGLKAVLGQGSLTHFILGNVVESITVESVGSSQAIISLSTPANKNLYLQKDKAKNVDTDADGYRDLRVTLMSTVGGVADLNLEKMEVVKINSVVPGDLIKIAGDSAVYYYGADSQRYVFPNEKVFYGWFDNFDKVITIEAVEMAKLPIAGLVTYRPGVKLVTFTTTKDVYVVSQGGVLRKLKNEEMARNLYGETWNKLVDDISDAFFSSYSFGDDLVELADYNKEAQEVLSPNIGVDKEI